MAARRYQNFDLSLEAAGDGSFRARVAYCPAGEFSPVLFSLPFEGTELDYLMLRLDPGRSGIRRSGGDSQRQAGADLGGVLFDAVFRDDVMLAWSRSQDVTRTAGEGLRLRLRLTDAPQLAGLPWELLYDRRTNSYVAQSARTPLVRYLEVPHPPRPLTVGGALRILVVLSAPTNLPDLDVEAEWRRVQEATETKVRNGTVVVERLPAPTMAELSAWLEHEDVHILHFVGHGDYDERVQSGVVYFCDQYGRSVAVGPDLLGPFLHDHDPLRLVLLNACRSARVDDTDPFSGMAQGLVQQDVTAVVAMQFPISDRAAVAFTSTFYGAVSDGIPLDQAATEARKALLISHPGEWATPVLFLRAPDGRVFDEITTVTPAVVGPAPTEAARPRSGSDALSAVTDVAPERHGLRRGWTRRRLVAVIAAGLVLTVGGVVTALLLRSGDGSTGQMTGEDSYTTTVPWRLRVDGSTYGNGCSVTLTDVGSGIAGQAASGVYGITNIQIHQTGSFRWQTNDRHCLVTPFAGPGDSAVPFTQEQDGDTNAFTAPSRGVSAQVKDFHGNPRCVLRLFDAANGQQLDVATATPGSDTVPLDPNGRATVYLNVNHCVVRISGQP